MTTTTDIIGPEEDMNHRLTRAANVILYGLEVASFLANVPRDNVLVVLSEIHTFDDKSKCQYVEITEETNEGDENVVMQHRRKVA